MTRSPEIPLFRDGRAILKVRRDPMGQVTLFKPFVIKPIHIMSITGAPGWDQHFVDEVFNSPVVEGTLEYIQDGVRFSIPIGEFREHAFLKEVPPHGPQYNVHRKYFRQVGVVKTSPLREEVPVEMPKRVTFGEYIPCRRCHGDTKKARTCKACQGTGLQKTEAV